MRSITLTTMSDRRRNPPRPEEMTQRARQLRHDSTGPEKALWRELRNRRLGRLKFRRQVPIGPYVVDFLCEYHHLVVELDGDSHVGRAVHDGKRTAFLESKGFRVIRFDNDSVLREVESVLAGILLACGMNVT